MIKASAMPLSPWITSMVPKENNPEDYEITGWHAEVFFALQVRCILALFFFIFAKYERL